MVDYISMIGMVADESHQASTTIARRIWEQWEDVEASAKSFWSPYDVLHAEFQHRKKIRQLITLLYETKTGSPKDDCEQLRTKDAAYGGSWAKRGGQGAFMMLARKADRFAQVMPKYDWDVARACADTSGDAESLKDTIGDWRRYLILVEAWHVAREMPNTMPESVAKTMTHQLGSNMICIHCGAKADRLFGDCVPHG